MDDLNLLNTLSIALLAGIALWAVLIAAIIATAW